MERKTNLLFSTFQHNSKDPAAYSAQRSSQQGCQSHADSAQMDYASVVGSADESHHNGPLDTAEECHIHAAASEHGAQSIGQSRVHGNIQRSFEARGISVRAAEICNASWDNGTSSQYKTYIDRWHEFCCQREISEFSPSVGDVLDYLAMLFDQLKLGYSAINTARSALSSFIIVDGMDVGKHPIVARFLRGVFKLKPALPRYNVIWDANIVLEYLKSLSPVKNLSLKLLTHKLVMLMLLLSGQRGQTIHLAHIANIDISPNRFYVTIGDSVKTTKPGRHVEQLRFKAYAPDKRLDVHFVLQEYLRRTLLIRGKEMMLFVSYVKPHKAVTRSTISRWTKECMMNAGVNMNIFSPHSCRAASTSKAKNKLQLKTILKTAGWTNANTFTKYYDKPIVESYDDAVLQ